MDIGELKKRIPMTELARRLGFEPNRAGFIHCPFHDERTPSLKLYDGDGGFSCYGCGAAGDQIDFLQRLHGVDFNGALSELAGIAGVTIDRQKPARKPGLFAERAGAIRKLNEIKLKRLTAELGELYREEAGIAEALRDPDNDGFAGALYWQSIVHDAIERLEYERNKIDH